VNIVERKSTPKINIKEKVFTEVDVHKGIKRLAAGKAKSINGLQVEPLKWRQEILSQHIAAIFNQMVKEG
jgi:hypothetical protein